MWQRTFLRVKHLPNQIPARAASTGQSYLHLPGREPLRYCTAGEALSAAANRYPDRLAIVSPYEGVQLTYEQLLTKADALGCALRARGLTRGSRLGVSAHNGAAWMIALVGSMRAGVIPVAINPAYEKPELSFCIKKTSLEGLLIGRKTEKHDFYSQLSEMIPELRSSKPGHLESKDFPSLRMVITEEEESLPGTESIQSLMNTYEKQSQTDNSKYAAEVNPDHGAIIHFTSGTTGDPKAALVSHFSVVNNTRSVGIRNTLHEVHHKVSIQVPLFHALGSVVAALSSLQWGATLFLAAPTYNVDANLRALIEEKCSVVIGTPTMYVDLVSRVSAGGSDLVPRKLAVALTAGAPCSPQLFQDIRRHLRVHEVKSLYGMTELTASAFMSLPGESEEVVTQTVGHLQDHLEVKVVDDEEKIVPFGCPGQLLVRGYNTMMCYWDEPSKTQQTLGADGWLRTGDEFTISPDGYGRIVGRQKDIIVRGGENIAPKEIEDLLDTHPAVMESQVIGVRDDRLGEEICAVVRLREGGSLSEDDVRRHCAGTLAKFKIPRLLRVTDQFPKTVSGKIQKFKLRQMVEEGKL